MNSFVQFSSVYFPLQTLHGLQENVAIDLIWKLEYYGQVILIMFKINTGDEPERAKLNKKINKQERNTRRDVRNSVLKEVSLGRIR